MALAFTLSKTVKVLGMYGLLTKKIVDLQFSHNLRFLGKMVVAVGTMIIVMSGYQGWFTSQFELSSFFTKALLIGSCGSIGVLTFFIATIIFRVQEVHLVLQATWKYVRR